MELNKETAEQVLRLRGRYGKYEVRRACDRQLSKLAPHERCEARACMIARDYLCSMLSSAHYMSAGRAPGAGRLRKGGPDAPAATGLMGRLFPSRRAFSIPRGPSCGEMPW